jgi:hypothetical protein
MLEEFDEFEELFIDEDMVFLLEIALEIVKHVSV